MHACGLVACWLSQKFCCEMFVSRVGLDLRVYVPSQLCRVPCGFNLESGIHEF